MQAESGFFVVLIFVQAGFGNRLSVEQSPDARGKRCRVRSRLTPSLPSKAGAMWYSVPVPVTRGFETLFTFQASVCNHLGRMHILLYAIHMHIPGKPCRRLLELKLVLPPKAFGVETASIGDPSFTQLNNRAGYSQRPGGLSFFRCFPCPVLDASIYHFSLS